MLPAEYYTSQEVFGEEMGRIFGSRWLFAGHVSQLSEPGSHFLFELGRESVIVTRDKEGQVRAFNNVCRHRGARICTDARGRFKGGIQCPYHAWTYGLDGTLTAAPNMDEVEGFVKTDFPLNALSTEVWEGLVFVNFSSAPVPFEEAFAPLLGKFSRWHIPELQSVHRTVYDVDANWKLLFQNYSECYHCPTVHPVLNKLTPYRNSINDLEEGPFLGGPMRMSIEGGSMTMSGRACAAPLGEITGEDLDLVYYYTLFPNLFLSLHPDYVLIHRGEPQGPARTRIVCEWFFHPEAVAKADFDASGAIEFWDMTNRQDWHLCTLSQQGISSGGYTPGPYADLESQLAAFDREYLRSLGHG
jgi:Rieske 2Fe-2S family protein